MYAVAINVADSFNDVLQYAIVLSCNSPYNSCQLQYCIKSSQWPDPKICPLGPPKVKSDPKIKSKSKVKFEENIENKSCSTT